MSGFYHHASNDIRQIANLLRYSYRTGISIVRELVQNADDAGATRLDLVLIEGLPEATNPLLRGPALACVNDGPFTDVNARAIMSLGGSEKGLRKSAVGRFGLGQKSVFHLCEAFFFTASDDGKPEDSDAPRTNVLDPWSEVIKGDPDHPDWDRFDLHDRQTMVGALREYLQGPQWFVLWLPLRQRDTLIERAGSSRSTPPSHLYGRTSLIRWS